VKRFRIIDLILALLSIVLASAQDQVQKAFGPLSVETPEGRFELRDLRLWEYSSLRPGFIGPRPSGLIENHTGTAWEKLELIARVQCPGFAPKMIPIFLYNIGESESQRFKSSSSDADNFCDAELLDVKFDHGTNVRAAERAAAEARQQATKEAADEAARHAVEVATEGKRLAKEQAEENESHAVEVAAETKRLSAQMVALRVPGGHDAWAGAVDCQSALRLYEARGKIHSEIRDIGGLAQPYDPGRSVAVLSRAENCAEVRFIEEGRDLYIAGLLVPQSQEERAAAARSAKAEKDRADRAAALTKLQADREALERAREATERAKLQAACAAVFKATGNKKVSDLTVVESQQIQACTTLGMYHQ
jgi:hypothetical protein